MLDKFGFGLGLLALLIGLALLYGGVFKGDPTQLKLIIIGAALFSLGLLALALTAKNWRQWGKSFKGHDR
jgi:hypothetical protein